MVDLKKVGQENRMIENFVQEFRRVVRGSKYKRKPLVEEFKRKMNRFIRRKLMETEQSPRSTK